MAGHASERELEQPRATVGAQHQQVGAEIEGRLPDGLAGRMLAGFQTAEDDFKLCTIVAAGYRGSGATSTSDLELDR